MKHNRMGYGLDNIIGEVLRDVISRTPETQTKAGEGKPVTHLTNAQILDQYRRNYERHCGLPPGSLRPDQWPPLGWRMQLPRYVPGQWSYEKEQLPSEEQSMNKPFDSDLAEKYKTLIDVCQTQEQRDLVWELISLVRKNEKRSLNSIGARNKTRELINELALRLEDGLF